MYDPYRLLLDYCYQLRAQNVRSLDSMRLGLLKIYEERGGKPVETTDNEIARVRRSNIELDSLLEEIKNSEGIDASAVSTMGESRGSGAAPL
jgi:hypothetical protein